MVHATPILRDGSRDYTITRSRPRVSLLRLPVFSVPLAPFDPLQSPDAVHWLASVVAQLKVVPVPSATPGSAVVSRTVGAAPDPIATVALDMLPPPGPSQDSMNCSV